MIPFWKVESIGNDFPIVHESYVAQMDLPQLAIAMSDRHFGVGGDGLLTLKKISGARVQLRMFNPDGTEDFCGNGIRCAAWHAHQEGWVTDVFEVVHLDRAVPVQIARDGTIRTDIGNATYEPDRVPVQGFEHFDVNVWSGMDAGMPLALFGSVLSTGSTHTIIPTSALPDDDTFRSVSAKIEVDPRFPDRTSVIWCQVIAEDELRIRIWERGAGETQGCGTGSSAAAVDYLRRKGRGGRVTVHNPGGDLRVEMDRWDAPVTIYGTSKVVFHGEYQFKGPNIGIR